MRKRLSLWSLGAPELRDTMADLCNRRNAAIVPFIYSSTVETKRLCLLHVCCHLPFSQVQMYPTHPEVDGGRELQNTPTPKEKKKTKQTKNIVSSWTQTGDTDEGHAAKKDTVSLPFWKNKWSTEIK